MSGWKMPIAERSLRRLQAELLDASEIVVSGTLHAGVKVLFGSFEHVFLDTEQAVRLSYDVASESLRIEPLTEENQN